MVIICSKIAYFLNLLLIFENNSRKTDFSPFLSTGVHEETSTVNDSFLKHRHWNSYCADLQSGDLQSGDLQGVDLQAGDLQGGELQGGDLQAGDLQVGLIKKNQFLMMVAAAYPACK